MADAKLHVDVERTVFTVAVGNINLFDKNSRAAVKLFKKLSGFVALAPCYPRGTLLVFDNENAAKKARNRLESEGVRCGVNICRAYMTNGGLRIETGENA